MDRFDEKIIGYESTKNILRQILDTLKRPELYKSKGASIPRGLLMESDPGLGKSLLATVFIKESGRKSYDAGRLFNETLIFYNHVYSYIFNKLDDNGKLELTKYSIECERKQG